MAPRPYRRFLPIWLWIVLTLFAGFIGWIRFGHDSGDQGLTNVSTMMLLLLVIIITTPWFVFFSRFRRRTRFLSFGAALLALMAFLVLFRFESFSGSMIPQFSLRHGGEPPALDAHAFGPAADVIHLA